MRQKKAEKSMAARVNFSCENTPSRPPHTPILLCKPFQKPPAGERKHAGALVKEVQTPLQYLNPFHVACVWAG